MGNRTGLSDALSVQLVLVQTCSYLPLRAILALASVSKSLQSTLYHSPGVFHRIDISHWKEHKKIGDRAATRLEWEQSPVQALLRMFTRRRLLAQVQILAVDGQPIDFAEFRDVLLAEAPPLRILSIIGCVPTDFSEVVPCIEAVARARAQEAKATLGVYICRDVSTPIVNAASESPAPQGVTTALGATLGDGNSTAADTAAPSARSQQHPWYRAGGHFYTPELEGPEGPESLERLRRIEGLYLDVLPCRGPKHAAGWSARLATAAVRGCAACGGAPEGLVDPATAPSRDLPLLTPVPRGPSVRRAQQPRAEGGGGAAWPGFLARCAVCLVDRWCFRCGRFWCENCYDPSGKRAPMGLLGSAPPRTSTKVFNGLCIEKCLVEEMYNGAGSGGMWG